VRFGIRLILVHFGGHFVRVDATRTQTAAAAVGHGRLAAACRAAFGLFHCIYIFNQVFVFVLGSGRNWGHNLSPSPAFRHSTLLTFLLVYTDTKTPS
jgi:hypothetical protein